MTVWWKFNNVMWSSAQMRETGLMDHILKIEHRPFLASQLKLWIGKP